MIQGNEVQSPKALDQVCKLEFLHTQCLSHEQTRFPNPAPPGKNRKLFSCAPSPICPGMAAKAFPVISPTHLLSNVSNSIRIHEPHSAPPPPPAKKKDFPFKKVKSSLKYFLSSCTELTGEGCSLMIQMMPRKLQVT